MSGCPKVGFGDAGSSIGAAAGTAVLGPGAGTVVGSIAGSLFHTSAAGPNAAAANQVAPEVARGNLAAVAATITRDGIQTQSSKLPWASLLATIPQNLVDAANQAFPGNNWPIFGAIDPTQVYPTVIRLAKYYNPATGEVTTTKPTTFAAGGGNLAGLMGGGSLPMLLLAGGGLFLLTKLVGSPRRRRR